MIPQAIKSMDEYAKKLSLAPEWIELLLTMASYSNNISASFVS
jgi:hypothetical protein